MESKIFILFLMIFCVQNLSAAESEKKPLDKSFGIGKQQWGFVNVREGAHLFWWLHHTTAQNISKSTEKPLIIWLQGGPGASSSGYGNFEEIGPFDLELNERNHTWVKNMNVLFVDSPVGTGFSYVEHEKHLTRDNKQAALDLIELLRGFYKELPEFKSVPLHIFGESYGGKVAVEFAYLLHEEIRNKTIECNLQSVNSVDGWISPIDSMKSWAPYLYHMGFVDKEGHDAIKKSTKLTKKAIERGQYELASDLWGRTEGIILEKTGGIDFYNVMNPVPYEAVESRSRLLGREVNAAMYRRLVKYNSDDRDSLLESLMIESISEALNISKTAIFGSQSSQTFMTLTNEFMKPVVNVVEKLLNETSVQVNIISGQLDLIVATPGTVKWVKKMHWHGAKEYKEAKREAIAIDNILEGYYKTQGNFTFYWINRAGHMVPLDNPKAMNFLLQKITKYHETEKSVENDKINDKIRHISSQ